MYRKSRSQQSSLPIGRGHKDIFVAKKVDGGDEATIITFYHPSLSLFHGQLVPIFSNVKKNLHDFGRRDTFLFALVRRASLESLLLKNVFKGLSTINIHMFRDSRLDLSPLDVKKPRVITSNSSSLLQVNKGWLTRSDGSQSCVALSFPFFLSSSLSPLPCLWQMTLDVFMKYLTTIGWRAGNVSQMESD